MRALVFGVYVRAPELLETPGPCLEVVYLEWCENLN